MQEGEIKVAVLGAAGYAGGELLRLLHQHPKVGAVRAFSSSHAGQPLSAAHPSLIHVQVAEFEATAPKAAAEWADVLFCALPHGESQTIIDELLTDNTVLFIDLAADFRIADTNRYEAYYGAHTAPHRLGEFTYGLADVLGKGLAGATRIASPGCFATACLLGLYPFVPSLCGKSVCFGITGSTGSGAKPKPSTHHPARAHNLFAYEIDGHRHEAEINHQLAQWQANGQCRLLPHSGPFVRGIHATLSLVCEETLGDSIEQLHDAYAASPFVRVYDTPPQLAAVVGTNFAHLHATRHKREVIVTCVIDNLVKGAAGQAIQSMNLALGFDETAGLTFPGLFPC
ncbi:MAG: N-acetyl-gamma-glutamyl-phosphate reductase [Deltaproteobacteria bacterium RIFOXYA12_FULL_58_15]|nr:MAG: N-acetyl-gamma-glutamyl-phosphate reductase [Deltaproteobacteria bacterium RIFOXYA12_FULL_58_15]OGR15235.1 MAG: N-acetyl-gamma-glutamyl-phosphate reductase [Deltaproteobacteria bacterium RIFOXYB12_FULL_58_9]